MIHPKEVGKTIRSLRQSRGLTQGQLAELLGVSRVTVSDWERGRASPRSEVVFDRIQEVLGLDVRKG